MKPSAEFDLLFLLRMLESLEKILLYSQPYSEALTFFEANNQMEFNACLNLLSQVGENANKVSMETQNLGSEIEWSQLYGLRNRAVHDYTGIDKFLTFEIIKNAVPEAIRKLSSLIASGTVSGYFQCSDLAIAKTSPYLKNVDFKSLTEFCP